jgi:hypothetical protein
VILEPFQLVARKIRIADHLSVRPDHGDPVAQSLSNVVYHPVDIRRLRVEDGTEESSLIVKILPQVSQPLVLDGIVDPQENQSDQRTTGN